MFIPDTRQPDGVLDPVFGLVHRGFVHGLWAVCGDGIGLAQLTGGARVLTEKGDGTLSASGGRLRGRAQDRHVDLAGQRFTLHQTSPRRGQLRRDGVPVCWLEAVHPERSGRLRRSAGSSYAIVQWADPPDRIAAAIAHLLASRFGVGALLALPARGSR